MPTAKKEETMGQMTFGQEHLQHIVLADADAYAEAATSPERMWEQLEARNGGPDKNMRQVHYQLHDLISSATQAASLAEIALPELLVVCPQLMSFRGWRDYAELLRNFNFNLNQLRTWFIMKHGVEFVFHILSARRTVTISFLPRTASTNAPWCDFSR